MADAVLVQVDRMAHQVVTVLSVQQVMPAPVVAVAHHLVRSGVFESWISHAVHRGRMSRTSSARWQSRASQTAIAAETPTSNSSQKRKCAA